MYLFLEGGREEEEGERERNTDVQQERNIHQLALLRPQWGTGPPPTAFCFAGGQSIH